jgi:hypothetical protein
MLPKVSNPQKVHSFRRRVQVIISNRIKIMIKKVLEKFRQSPIYESVTVKMTYRIHKRPTLSTTYANLYFIIIPHMVIVNIYLPL